jgi:hypothetical protein
MHSTQPILLASSLRGNKLSTANAIAIKISATTQTIVDRSEQTHTCIFQCFFAVASGIAIFSAAKMVYLSTGHVFISYFGGLFAVADLPSFEI